MSSLLKKGMRPEKSTLPKTDYFEKIKCSAYPLLGSIFSRDSSFINALNSSLASVKKPTIVLVIPTIRIVCVAIAILFSAIRKLTGGVSSEKLDQLIERINQLKSQHYSYSVQKVIKRKASSCEKEVSSLQSDEVQAKIFHDSKEVEDQLQSKLIKCINNHRLLRVTSISCIALVYSQFVFLLYLIGCSQFKVGFFFLLLCVLMINFFVFKISFITKTKETKRRSRKESATNKVALNSTRPMKKFFAQFRSRSRKMENCLQKAKLL